MKSWVLRDDLKLAWNILQNKITLYAACIEKGIQNNSTICTYSLKEQNDHRDNFLSKKNLQNRKSYSNS